MSSEGSSLARTERMHTMEMSHWETQCSPLKLNEKKPCLEKQTCRFPSLSFSLSLPPPKPDN